jgi:hypothetical protein
MLVASAYDTPTLLNRVMGRVSLQSYRSSLMMAETADRAVNRSHSLYRT